MRFLLPLALLMTVALVPVQPLAQTGGNTSKNDRQERPRREYKPQAEVAAKGDFGTIKESDPAVKKALDAKDLSGGTKLIGKEAAFQGNVAKVYTSEGDTVVILNFDKNFRSAMTAVLKPADYAKFPVMAKLDGKHVLVTGKLAEYRGQPEIELTKPEQIKVIIK
jgi:DNA/RNA endonuclease YhcR with UshA esterase domain